MNTYNILRTILYSILALCISAVHSSENTVSYFEKAETSYKNKAYKEALEYYKKAAGQGDTKSFSKIGLIYNSYALGKPDYKQALPWLKRAADVVKPS